MIFSYIQDRKFPVLIYIMSICIFILVFSLYQIEVEAVFYAFVLVTLFISIICIFDFYKYYKQHQTLEVLKQANMIDLAKDLKDVSLKGKDYHDILVLMQKQHLDYVSKIEQDKQDMLDYFTMWAHQVKLPISAMKLIMEDEKIDVRELKAQLLKMEQYTDMAMAYLRLGSDHSDYVLKEFCIDELVRKIIRRFRSEFIRKHIQLIYEGVDLVVLSDEKWLGFVLEQLISNAIKYTNHGGCISIYQKDHSLIIQDSGIGIDEADLYRIFEKGYTGNNGRLHVGASGLGLYLVKMVLNNLHHGIYISSKVNEGTCVQLNLDYFKDRLE